jgi:TolB-like protein/DNA-binding winged helix-turn-helix (wHTH) protein
MTTAEVNRLLDNAAPIFVTPGFVTTRNNTRWLNGRDQLIPKSATLHLPIGGTGETSHLVMCFPRGCVIRNCWRFADRMGVTFSRSAVRMPAPTSRHVRFGDFELDLTTGELRSTETADGNNVLLREQVFQALRMLLEREGKIVTRDEIKSRLWANDTVVDFDHSINATIKALRRALGDSADNPRYIETLARRGYRFMVPIQYLDSAPETALEKDREQREQSAPEMSENAARVQRQVKPHWWKAALVLAAAVILVGAGYISWRHVRATESTRSDKIRLAVLPFQNLTGDPNKDYLADGLTEEMISQVGRLNPEQLGVIARTSVMGYKHNDVRLDQIGRDLSVQYVLENSLRESGNHLRLTAQLIQVKDQTHLWSRDYDYPAKDILNVEDDVAKAVARQIQLRLTSQQQAEVARSRPVNPEAFDAYLQGYYYFERDTDKDADMAAKYYERATQLEPSYALAWVGLSRARNWQANQGLIPAEEGHRLAREAVERALALNPTRGALSNRPTSIGLERMLPSSGRLLSNPEIPTM